MAKVFGYVTSRPFGDFIIPVPAQNTCLREYAANKKLQYVLPQLEHKFDECFMQMWTTLRQMSEGDILAMYSAEMIIYSPKAINILQNIVNSNIKAHFILENQSIATLDDIKCLMLTAKIRQKTLKKSTLLHRLSESCS